MSKSVEPGPEARGTEKTSAGRGVVDLADARVRLRSHTRGGPSQESLRRDLDEIHSLLDQGLTVEARSRLTSIITASRQNPSILALARCALSTALEMQSHYHESLAAVAMYESPESRTKLDEQADSALRVQISLAYNYNGDHPKAISLLKSAVRELGEGNDARLGAIYSALARVYRSISEFPIARDYSERALEHFRNTGDWRGLADAYFGLALADMHEGNYESTLENLEQALKLIGDHPASFMLGKIYSNMAGACWYLKRPQEGIRYLEKAIDYYERTDHKGSAANGYNNLAVNLILIGQWDRAQEALKRALTLASELDAQPRNVPMILDSLGELDECSTQLQKATEATDSHSDLNFTGEAQRLYGKLAMAQSDPAAAAQHFGRSVSIFDMLGDRYRGARAHYELGRAYAVTQPARAIEHLSRAVNTFRELGARLDLTLAEESLATVDRTIPPEQQPEPPALTQLLTIRLAEAVASRELLLREFAATIP